VLLLPLDKRLDWRDADGRQGAETHPTRRGAAARERALEDLRERGRLDAVGAGRESLREATEPWWTDHVEPRLAQSTVLRCAHVFDCHLLPRLGATPIRDINPALVLALQRDLRADGVGVAMTHRILMVLSVIMRHAVLRGRIDRNLQPVRVVQPKRRRAIRLVPPADIERIRRALLTADDQASATLVSLMAYAGLRPSEATALCWRPHRQVHDPRRAERRRVRRSEGHQDRLNPHRRAARAASLRPRRLAHDGRQRAGRGRPDRAARRRDHVHGYRYRRRHRFDPAVDRAGLPITRPYDLRHSYASLMIQAGYSPAELGHATTLTLDTYAHLFSEFARGERVDPEGAIRDAR